MTHKSANMTTATVFRIGTITSLCIALIYWLFRTYPDIQVRTIATPKQHEKFSAPYENFWRELDEVETSSVYDFLHQNKHVSILNRPVPNAGKYIAFTEVWWPNKSTVLRHFEDQDAPGSEPQRYARVGILDLDKNASTVSDYLVGPLHGEMKMRPMRYNTGRNTVSIPIFDFFAFLEWVEELGDSVADITKDLLGAAVDRADPTNPEALVFGGRFASVEDGRIILWMEFFRKAEHSSGMTLLPQGLYLKLEVPSTDSSTWKILSWFYNGHFYADEESLRSAWSSKDFVKLQQNRDGPWTDTENFESDVAGREQLPPISVQPYGSRFQLDKKNKYVSWMGYTFFIATHQFTGLSLFDIRFDDERIIYELGLQEALAHYAGSEPLQSGLEWLDAFFGFGVLSLPLVPGYDCPSHAQYLDLSYHKGQQMFTNRNAICIFEFTDDAPLQRHSTAFGVSVSRNTYLVVRSVSTVGNYDYTIDFIMYLDGTIEVKVRASGYIFAAFNAENSSSTTTNTNEYGYRAHTGMMTSMHDHVLNFKADLDIAGTSNSFERVGIVPITRQYPWDQPEIGAPRNTMHMQHHLEKKEIGIDWPRNSGELYLIQSNETNKWGEQRSYRVMPGTGVGTPSHLTILNSTTLGTSALWSASDLWVLQNHDHEHSSAHHMNFLSPNKPLIDFGRMVNDEGIIEEDIVVYFNLGGHHVPNTQDIPNTLMHTSASSVMFSPFNFFDSDVSVKRRQGVRVDRRPHIKEDKQVQYFGGKYEKDIHMSRDTVQPDLTNYLKEKIDNSWRVVKNKISGPFGLYGDHDETDMRMTNTGAPHHDDGIRL